MTFKSTIAFLLLLFATVRVSAQSPAEIYAKRVLPLLKSNSNRCAACHFQGIDLSALFGEDPVQTFYELRERGWIDTQEPAKSKLLKFIDQHADPETDMQSRIRKSEYAAIQSWLTAACADPMLLKQPVSMRHDLELDLKLIHYTRIDQLETRFIVAIWSQLERCANCHSPERNSVQIQKHGELMSWIVPNQPLRTLELLTERKLINVDTPSLSPIRTKPTGLVKHGAGIKFPAGGETDSAWVAFLGDYSKTVRGEYSSSDELTEPSGRRRWRTGLHLRVTEIPESWMGRLVNVTIHNAFPDGGVMEEPVAFGESFVSKDRKIWSNSLELLSSDGTRDGHRNQPILLDDVMPAGKYELRIGPAGGKPTLAVLIEAPWESGHSSACAVSVKHMRSLRNQ